VIMAYRGSRPTAVWLIIGINLLLFIATLINRYLVIGLLGFQPASFLAMPWTIVTNLFIHGSIWHIFANMITLYFFGSFLCRLVGMKGFLLVYFAGGIAGNIFFLLIALYTPLALSSSIAIGTSGAVFALGGALAVMMPRLRVFVFPIPAPLPLWVAVIGGFIVLTIFSSLLNIAWQAHLGGLVFGLIAGYIFRRRIRYFYTQR
jgi:membrane associated rhomboid family serine protease